MPGSRRQIPRIIVQTWKTPRLPFPFNRFTKTLRALNRDFEYRFYSDGDVHDFIRNDYADFEPAFEQLRTPVERADLFRVLVVHRFGGFYFDLDVIPLRPLMPLLDHTCVFPFEQMADPYTAANFGIYEQLGQYAFGAAPGHPLLQAYAENIRRVALTPAFGPPSEAVERHTSPNEAVRIILSTGPGMLARTLGTRPELAEGLSVIAAKTTAGKRMSYCFGTFGLHAMLGSFGWRASGPMSGLRAVKQWGAWVRQLRDAYRRADAVARCRSECETWAKPAPWPV